jgi:hypothetical protein
VQDVNTNDVFAAYVGVGVGVGVAVGVGDGVGLGVGVGVAHTEQLAYIVNALTKILLGDPVTFSLYVTQLICSTPLLDNIARNVVPVVIDPPLNGSVTK